MSSPFRLLLSRAATLAAVALLASSIGCNSLTTLPTNVSTNSQYSTFVITRGGSAITTFTLTATTTVGIALVSIVSQSDGSPLNPEMTLSLGAPATATTCTPTNQKTSLPSLVATIQTSLPAGTYCVAVQDAGLGETGVGTVRINTSSGNPVTDPSPATVDIFASSVGPQGSATHQLPIAFNGQMSLTLISAGTANNLGVAFGAWDGSVCRLNAIVQVVSGTNPVIANTVDPGNYCIKVFDLGNLTAAILFTIDTVIP